MDASGNIYLEHLNEANVSASNVSVISMNGANVSQPWPYDEYRSWNYKGASDGILYYATVDSPKNRSLSDLDSLSLTAYDVKNGTSLWSFALQPPKKTTFTLDETSIKNIFDPYTSGDILNSSEQRYPDGAPSTKIIGHSDVNVLPSSSGVYVSYIDYNYEYPIVPGQSQCVYTSGIISIGTDGRMLWQQSTDSSCDGHGRGQQHAILQHQRRQDIRHKSRPRHGAHHSRHRVHVLPLLRVRRSLQGQVEAG